MKRVWCNFNCNKYLVNCYIRKHAFYMTDSTVNLYFKSKNISLVILAVTAMACSRTLFFFFNDAEGPNALIVAVLTLAVFAVSSVAYLFISSPINGVKRLLAAICIQILLVAGLYFGMR